MLSIFPSQPNKPMVVVNCKHEMDFNEISYVPAALLIPRYVTSSLLQFEENSSEMRHKYVEYSNNHAMQMIDNMPGLLSVVLPEHWERERFDLLTRLKLPTNCSGVPCGYLP